MASSTSLETPRKETERQKNDCLTLAFNGKEIRIIGKITSFWLVGSDIYNILAGETQSKAAGIEELIKTGIGVETLSSSEIGVVVNLIGLEYLIRWGMTVDEKTAIEFKEWIFSKMFREVWNWTNEKYEPSR